MGILLSLEVRKRSIDFPPLELLDQLCEEQAKKELEEEQKKKAQKNTKTLKNEYTTIMISKDVWQKLKEIKGEDESFQDVILKLLNLYERQNKQGD